MNDDLISRQAAIDDIETVNPSMLLDVDWVKNWVKTLPSAQPEIIRCWNCKHFIGLLDEKSAKKYGQEYECECGRLNKPEPDDFCSRAERKENR